MWCDMVWEGVVPYAFKDGEADVGVRRAPYEELKLIPPAECPP